MEARIIAGALLPRFRFRLATDETPQPQAAITLRIKNGLRLKLEPR